MAWTRKLAVACTQRLGNQRSNYKSPLISARFLHATVKICKRNDGNSASIPKKRNLKASTKRKTKEKLKKDAQPHLPKRILALQKRQAEERALRNKKAWKALDEDVAYQRELDQAFEYLNSLGPEHLTPMEQETISMKDVDDAELLDTLNAVAIAQDPNRKELTTETSVQESVPIENDQILEAEEEVDLTSQPLSVDAYNNMLRVLALKGKYADANALLHRMEKNLKPVDIERVHLFTAGSTSHEDEKRERSAGDTNVQLLLQLENIPHRFGPNARSYMHYLCALADSKERDAAATAIRTLGRMKAYGVTPDTVAYTCVMNVCVQGRKLHWAYNIMDKMQIAGCIPTAASFTILMKASLIENNLDKALETFHLMRSHGIEPDVVSFTTLIDGYAKCGRVERALNLMEDLIECDLHPNEITFNVLINACAKSRYYAHKAIEFYHEMQEMYDYRPTLYTYNTVLHACAMQGDVLQAEMVVRHMKKHGMAFDAFTYTSLLQTYARANVRRILNTQPKNKKPLPPLERIRQDQSVYDEDSGRTFDTNRIKTAALDHSMDDEFMSFDENESIGEELDEENQNQVNLIRAADQKRVHEMNDFDVLNAILDTSNFGEFQKQNIKKAEELFAEMTKTCVSTIMINCMLSVYAQALHLRRAEKFYEETFVAFGKEPDHFTYRILMQMYVRARNTELAERLLYETIEPKIERQEIKADGVVYGLLVDHHTRFGRVQKALVILELAHQNNVTIYDKYYKKIRTVTEKMGLYTHLIPEDPKLVVKCKSRQHLIEKRRLRKEVLEYNRQKGKHYILPTILH